MDKNLGRMGTFFQGLSVCVVRIMSAGFSAIMITGALVLPEVMVGIAEASTTRRPATRYTRQSGSGTVPDDRGKPCVSKAPIAQVPTG